MANDPRPVVVKASEPGGLDPKRPSLSVEDAELFASRIQPSWELIDDSLRSELAAELGLGGPDTSASKPAGDTIIEGVPSVAIGSGALAVPPEAPVEERIAGIPVVAVAGAAEQRSPEAQPPPAEPAASAPAAPSPAAEAKKPPAAPPARAGKTKTGVGDGPKSGGVAKTLPDTAAAAPKSQSGKAPVSVSRSGAAAKPAGKSSPGVVAASASRPDTTDDIEIPVTGASKAQVIKFGLGAVAVCALAAIGYGAVGGSGDKKDTAPTATSTATAKAAVVPLPATIPPPPPAEPTAMATAPKPSATATSAAPTATATSAAPIATATSAAPIATATSAAATAAPRAPEAKAEPRKVAPPPGPAVPSTSAPAVKKSGGGIIRDSPF